MEMTYDNSDRSVVTDEPLNILTFAPCVGEYRIGEIFASAVPGLASAFPRAGNRCAPHTVS